MFKAWLFLGSSGTISTASPAAKGLPKADRVPFFALLIVVVVLIALAIDAPKTLLAASVLYALSGPLRDAIARGNGLELGTLALRHWLATAGAHAAAVGRIDQAAECGKGFHG